MTINELIYYLQSANINFILGSGASRPYLSVLGNIEELLTKLNKDDTTNSDDKIIIESSIYRYFFENVIKPNAFPDKANAYFKTAHDNYVRFLTVWNDLLSKRQSRILNKQINVFTTNYDLLIEEAASSMSIELNDGFKGSFKSFFDETNFMRSVVHTSLHFHHTSEVPVFNLLKIHGSVNWKQDEEKIINDNSWFLDIESFLKKIPDDEIISLLDGSRKKTYAELVTDAGKVIAVDLNPHKDFIEHYKELVIVNPTKRKFSETVIDDHFYELMRMYSNALEKENSILFAIGFSFADEHIAKITKRAADSNPTLKIVVFAYKDDEESTFKHRLDIEHNCINNNILVLTPEKFVNSNSEDDRARDLWRMVKTNNSFDLCTINQVFEHINSRMHSSYE